MRFFSVFSIQHPNQKEKVSKPKDGMILKGKEPAQAAKKAMSKICKRMKKKGSLKGRCALRLTMIELQSSNSGESAKTKNGQVFIKKNSKGAPKLKSYRLQFKKLTPPLVVMRGGKKITFKHKPVVTSFINKKYMKTASKKAMSLPTRFSNSMRLSPKKKRTKRKVQSA